MALPEADRWFARYVETGDPEALGRVFDLAAPRLLVLALHLTRLPQEAEDLVQSTFVAAIESAARFDRAQPVLPWLSGILANHARRLLRRRAAAPDPERVHPRREAEPPEAAGARELTTDVVTAVNNLPETYRTVLLLRLLHGLDPAEIGHTLGHPLETVRTRLKRGLARLRQVLPRGLSVPAVVGLDTAGLGSVRAAVLAHAAALRTPLALAAFTLGGTLIMKKILAVTAAAAALFATFWFARPILGLGEDSASAAPSSPMAASAPAAVPEQPPNATTRPDMRVAAGGQPHAPASLPSRASISGRCVAAETGLPLAGAVVTLEGRPSTSTSTLIVWDWGPKEWQELQPVTTGADGRFAFAFDPPHGFVLDATASAEGRMQVGATWRWQKDQNLDVGDVRLPPGVRARGRVLDTEGRILDGIVVSAVISRKDLVLPFGSEPGTIGGRRATSATDGTFDLGWLPPGTWKLRFGSSCRKLFEPEALVVPPDRAVVDVTVVGQATDARAVLSGVVVDTTGAPLSGLRVSCSPGPCAVGADWTGPDGRFRITGSGDPEQSVGVNVRVPAHQDVVEPEQGRRFAWGTEGVRVVVATSRPLAVDIQVVEADTLKPVEEFGVICCTNPRGHEGPFDIGWGNQAKPRFLGRHPGGRLRVDNLANGKQVLFVAPRSAAWHLAGPLQFDLPRADPTPVQVVLHRKGTFQVRVRETSGTPVAATNVQLLIPWGERPPDMLTYAVAADHLFSAGGGGSFAIRLSEATTDDSGIAALEAPLGQQGLALRLPGPGHRPKVVLDVRPEPGEPYDVIVDAETRLTGRITPPDLVARLAQQARPGPGLRAGLRLRKVGNPAEWLPGPGPLHGFPVSDDGSFRIGGIKPGTWDIQLYWSTGRGFDTYGPYELDPPLQRVTIQDGEQRDVELDARAWTPGRLRGLILHDGKPHPGAAWSFRVTPPSGPPFWVSGPEADDQGRFHAVALLPGSYQLAVRLSAARSGSPRWLFDPTRFQVGRGEEIEREFALVSRRLQVHVTGSDGLLPVPERRLFLRWDEAGMSYSRPEHTDKNGVLILDPPPQLPVVVEVRAPDCDDQAYWRLTQAERERRTITLGTIQDDPSATELRVLLRLPAGIK